MNLARSRASVCWEGQDCAAIRADVQVPRAEVERIESHCACMMLALGGSGATSPVMQRLAAGWDTAYLGELVEQSPRFRELSGSCFG
jgi:hypothetical protein